MVPWSVFCFRSVWMEQIQRCASFQPPTTFQLFSSHNLHNHLLNHPLPPRATNTIFFFFLSLSLYCGSVMSSQSCQNYSTQVEATINCQLPGQPAPVGLPLWSLSGHLFWLWWCGSGGHGQLLLWVGWGEAWGHQESLEDAKPTWRLSPHVVQDVQKMPGWVR